MLVPFHKEMVLTALKDRFSPRALSAILAANLAQDSLRCQLGHDEFHYDNNAIDESDRYLKEQRGYILASLLLPDYLPAWGAFGRLIHTAQDFYAHTNYVALWLDQFDGTPPPPPEIDPVQKSLIQSPGLRSGKLYYPLELLYFIRPLQKFALSILPPDSHAHMNLDSPAQGPRFEYALAAAIKRTQYELEVLENILTPEMFERFTDLKT
ncbi:MAG: hypothetical protein HZB19_10435 [Chloroflexi bacterium]|nr:hypothetical protein [Chloroflexota bacterium]